MHSDHRRTASQSVKRLPDFTAYARVGEHPHGWRWAVDAERLEQAENPLDLVRFRVAIVRERDVQAGVSPAGLRLAKHVPRSYPPGEAQRTPPKSRGAADGGGEPFLAPAHG